MLHEVFESYHCNTRFALLSGVPLATTPLGNLLPEAMLPPEVKGKLNKEPFAIIFAPHRFTKNPEYWPRIVHEAAHNIDLSLKITADSIAHFKKHIEQLDQPLATSLISLCREQVADLLSVHYYGPAYGESALLVFLRGEPVALPTHPTGTHRLQAIANELEYMRFNKESKLLGEKIRQLGVEERLRDEVFDSNKIGDKLQDDLREKTRTASTKLGAVLHPKDVDTGIDKISENINYDSTLQRFVRLTPSTLSLRILFNSYRSKLEGRARPRSEESSEIHEWILDSIRMNPSYPGAPFRDFYSQ